MDATNPDLFETYPEVPGHRGIDTSVEAAGSVAPNVNRLRQMVLTAVTAAGPVGATVIEICDRTGLDRFTCQPRTTELRQLGLIADGGVRRANPSGRNAIAWVTPEHVPPAPDREAA